MCSTTLERFACRLTAGLFALVLAALPSRAAEIDPAAVQLWDVITMADGSVVKGVIIEEVPGTSLRVALAGGGALVVQLPSVVRLGKELNPAFAPGNAPAFSPGSAAARVATTASSAPVPVSGGLRLGLSPGIATHSEFDGSTFLLTARLGWEIPSGRWGITPGASLIYAPGTGIYGRDSYGVAAVLRAAYRSPTASPFLSFGIGVDEVGGDTSMATLLTAGVELMVHQRVALVVDGTFHRGYGGFYDAVLEFAALGVGVEMRL